MRRFKGPLSPFDEANAAFGSRGALPQPSIGAPRSHHFVMQRLFMSIM
jgi:hypothetical protein